MALAAICLGAIAGEPLFGAPLRPDDPCHRLRARAFPATDAPASLAVGDLDGDGSQDWVTGGKTAAASLTLWLFRDGPLADPTRVDLPATARVFDIDIGDVDGDRDLDIAIVQQTPCQYQVLLNDGRGAFTSLGPIAMTCSAFVRLFDVGGDVGGDGVPDLVTRTSADIEVRHGNGDGTFGSPITATVTGATVSGAQGIVVADVTGDGNKDLVLAVSSPNGLAVLTAVGGSLVAGPFTAAPTSMVGIAAEDIDADGDQDVVAFESSSSEVRFRPFLNSGTGAFAAQDAVPFTSVSSTPLNAIALADMDGYAGPDVVLARQPSRVLIAPNNGHGLFGPAMTLHVSADPAAITPVDLDADGDLDLALAYRGGDAVGRLLNGGGGGFDTPPLYNVGVTGHTLLTADVDGDNDEDLILAVDQSSSNTGFYIYRNISDERSEPAFAPPEIRVDVGGSGIDVADMDGDGDLDIVTCAYFFNEVNIHWNDGTGDFDQMTTVGSLVDPHSLQVGDLNGDGLLDILVAQAFSDQMNIYLAVGSSFAAPIEIAAGDGAFTSRLGDLDHDRDLDIVLTNYYAGTVSVWLNGGPATFTESTTFTVGGNPRTPELLDLNGDGALDIVTTSGTLGSIQLRRNDGSAGFAAPITLTLPGEIAAVNFEDDDGDGDLDLLVAMKPLGICWRFANDGEGAFVFESAASVGGLANEAALFDMDGDGFGELVVHASSGLAICKRVAACERCVGDLDGDGSVGAADLAIVLGAWGVRGAADLDGDGTVGGGDLAVLLGAWGGCE